MQPGEVLANGNFAIRGERYKLMRRAGNDELYDLAADPFEGTDLLTGTRTEDARSRYEWLASRLEALHATADR